MKVALLTDIHGNAPALKAVLNELDQEGDIDRIYCLGDMIAIGPDTNQVLDMLFSRNDVHMITGNHDEAVLALLKGERHPISHAHVRAHHEWICETLDEPFLPLLEKLPRMLQTTIQKQRLCLTHYHIDDKKTDAPISQDPFSPIVEPKLNKVENLFRNVKADVIGFGHHHPLHYFEGAKTTYINPGSLGCNDKPSAPYAIIKLHKGQRYVQLKEAGYDNRHFLKSYERLKVPDREFILKIFHGNQLKKRNVYAP